jgi:hypothetical protein
MAAIIGFQGATTLRNRMLPSKEDGVILVLHQGLAAIPLFFGRISSSIWEILSDKSWCC